MKNRVEILRNHIDEVLLNMTDAKERRYAYVHLYGVSQFCALIALKRGENVELATIAGMLHDLYTFQFMDGENHAHKGALLAREVLHELNLTSSSETDLICSAIHHHSSKREQHGTFDEVLMDADVMQHCLYNFSVPIMEHEIDRFNKLTVEFGLPMKA